MASLFAASPCSLGLAALPRPAQQWTPPTHLRRSSGRRKTTWCHAVHRSSDPSPSDAALPSASSSAADALQPAVAHGQQLQGHAQPVVARWYTAMAATSAVLGLLATLVPSLLLNGLAGAVGGGVAPLDVPFLRLAGATLGISAFTEYSLAEAARHGTLASSQGRFLSSAVLVKSCAYLLALALARDAWTAALFVLYPSAALVSIALNAYVLTSSRGISGSSNGSVPAMEHCSTRSESSLAVLFGINAMLFVADAARCYSPEAVFSGFVSPVGQLLRYTCAPGYLLCAAACYDIKRALEDGNWRNPTALLIAAGLSVSGFGYCAVMAAALLDGTATANVFNWVKVARVVVFTALSLLFWSGASQGGGTDAGSRLDV